MKFYLNTPLHAFKMWCFGHSANFTFYYPLVVQMRNYANSDMYMFFILKDHITIRATIYLTRCIFNKKRMPLFLHILIP